MLLQISTELNLINPHSTFKYFVGLNSSAYLYTFNNLIPIIFVKQINLIDSRLN